MRRKKDTRERFDQIVPVGNPDKVLNEQELAYVRHRAAGLNQTAAARLAGYAEPSASGGQLDKRPHIIAAMAVEAKAYEAQSDMKRKDVIEGIKAAIDQAVLMADPMAQIAGWRELAKICGYYAPEVKELKLSTDAQKLLKKFEDMTDEQLLELAARDAQPVLEAEYREVHD
jgi:hypothetical protein